MKGVYLKLAINLRDLQCNKFTVLAVCVPPFHLLKQLLEFLIVFILLLLFLSSSVTAAALPLNEPCKLHPIQPFSYP